MFKQSELTRSELVQVANEMDMKYAPSWIVKNDEYKMGNGLYSLFANSCACFQTATMNVPEQVQAKKQIAISDTTIHNLIPAVYANYVPLVGSKMLNQSSSRRCFIQSSVLVYQVMVRP